MKYISEIQSILNSKTLSDEIKRKNRFYLEWNSLSNKLQELDRIDAIKNYKKTLLTSKILKGNIKLEKIINIREEENVFIKYLEDINITSFEIDNFICTFKSYNGLSTSILQHKFVNDYFNKMIGKIQNKTDQNQIQEKYNLFYEIVNSNRTRPLKKEIKGKNKFKIERNTIDYFGIQNFQLINSLSNVGFDYELTNNNDGDIIIKFETIEKNLGILKIVRLKTNFRMKIPLANLGIFVDENAMPNNI